MTMNEGTESQAILKASEINRLLVHSLMNIYIVSKKINMIYTDNNIMK